MAFRIKFRFLRTLVYLVVLLAVAATAVTVYQYREISAQEYRQLSQITLTGSPDMRTHTAQFLAGDGRIKQWQFNALAKRYWPAGLVAPMNNASDVAAERQSLVNLLAAPENK